MPWPRSMASTHGPLLTYCTASSVAISLLVATRVKVTSCSREAMLTPTRPGATFGRCRHGDQPCPQGFVVDVGLEAVEGLQGLGIVPQLAVPGTAPVMPGYRARAASTARGDSTESSARQTQPTSPARSPCVAGNDQEVATGQGGGGREEGVAQARGERVEGSGHVAADDDGARVEHGDGGGQRLADAATRLAHDRPCLAVAVHGLGDEVAHVVRPAGHPPRSRSTSAQPPATVSRQPVSPQRHSSPSAAATLTWPSSPAAPR